MEGGAQQAGVLPGMVQHFKRGVAAVDGDEVGSVKVDAGHRGVVGMEAVLNELWEVFAREGVAAVEADFGFDVGQAESAHLCGGCHGLRL